MFSLLLLSILKLYTLKLYTLNSNRNLERQNDILYCTPAARTTRLLSLSVCFGRFQIGFVCPHPLPYRTTISYTLAPLSIVSPRNQTELLVSLRYRSVQLKSIKSDYFVSSWLTASPRSFLTRLADMSGERGKK